MKKKMDNKKKGKKSVKSRELKNKSSNGKLYKIYNALGHLKYVNSVLEDLLEEYENSD